MLATAAAALLFLAQAEAPGSAATGAPKATAPVAEVKQPEVEKKTDEPPVTYINLRVGASTGTHRPEFCGELGIWRISVEGCGSGSGFLHHDATPELTHFRAKFRLLSVKTPVGWLETRVAAGFAELAIGSDDGGFSFAGTNATRTSTAGPELGASLRLVYPLWVGFELLAELSGGIGIFCFARQLLTPQAVVQPSAGLSIGAGW
jgi:hypothetical protein